MSTLSDRIAGVLREPSSSAAVTELLLDATTELGRIERERQATRQKALDPLAAPATVSAARRELAELDFSIERLTVAVERLQAKQTEVLAREEEERRSAAYDAAWRERDALAEELRVVYPEAAARLADLFRRIEANNQAVRFANDAKPAGVAHLQFVEMIVRGLHPADVGNLDLVKQARLPRLEAPEARRHGPLWPPTSDRILDMAGASLVPERVLQVVGGAG